MSEFDRVTTSSAGIRRPPLWVSVRCILLPCRDEDNHVSLGHDFASVSAELIGMETKRLLTSTDELQGRRRACPTSVSESFKYQQRQVVTGG